MLIEFYTKHPKFLILTIILAIMGTLTFMFLIVRIMLLAQYCLTSATSNETDMLDYLCHLIYQNFKKN